MKLNQYPLENTNIKSARQLLTTAKQKEWTPRRLQLCMPGTPLIICSKLLIGAAIISNETPDGSYTIHVPETI
jgi:hypothetical protein